MSKPKELKERVITAVILILLVIAGVLGLPVGGFAIGLACVLMLAAWEWSSLIGLKGAARRLLYTACLLSVFISIYYINLANLKYIIWILVLVNMGWLYIALKIPSPLAGEGGLKGRKGGIIGLLILSGCWQGLILVRSSGPFYVLFILIFVWIIDSIAYFVGRALGKHKLASKISPNKTIEGALGGMLAGLMFTLLIFYKQYGMGILALAILSAIASIIGDLFESKMKRLAGVKDSGRLVRGHGGVLDRIDGLIAAAPVFALGWFLFIK